MSSEKDLLKQTLQAHADGTTDLDLMSSIGTPGNNLLIRGETVPSGRAYTAPSFLDSLLDAIATRLEARTTQQSYSAWSLPDPNPAGQPLIFVPDEIGGSIIAFSDGSNWRRVTDRAIVQPLP